MVGFALLALAETYGYNTRAAGIDTEHALIPVDAALVYWADEIVCMNNDQLTRLTDMTEAMPGKEFVCLDISDDYGYMDPKLVELIKERYADSD